MVKKVNVLSAIFEKYPNVLCCHTFLCRVNYRWSQSWMFYQPFLRNIPKCYVFTPFCAGLTTGGHKVECFISHFEKYPKMLCFHTFLCRVNYRWAQSWMFYQSFLRNIPKCYVFTPFCYYTHVNWLKPCHLATHNHVLWHMEFFCEKKVVCLVAICRKLSY